ncbi:transducin beta-like protein 2 [Oscarella lobularis]|uniref:transducin beta-like protein 2 n=1 Tax=Oscarella lobularis TaxID=121494 RepID=UPI003313A366
MDSQWLYFCLGVGAALLIIAALLKWIGYGSDSKKEAEPDEKPQQNAENSEETQEEGLRRRRGPMQKKGRTPAVEKHPLQAADLKGHTGSVLSLNFSPDGKCLASCSDDRTIRIWNPKDFLESNHKYIRANVELDYAKTVSFSPDSKAVVAAVDDCNTVRVFKVMRKKDGSGSCSAVLDFPQEHKEAILLASIASNGRFILTCYRDTSFIIWNLKGEVLARGDTKQAKNTFATVSPCGRFVATTGFTPDVKLWEVEFDKSDAFRALVRAMELKGHTASVYGVSFSKDSTRAATVSKDGSWKFWNIDVHYKEQQDPRILVTAQYDHQGPSIISLSPEGLVVAITCQMSIQIFNTLDGLLVGQLNNVHANAVTSLAWDPLGRYLASAGGEDKHIRVWHNEWGYRAQLVDLKEKIAKTPSQAHKERLAQQQKDAESALNAILSMSKSL